MNVSRLILVLWVSCLIIQCFGQDIDPDEFDFDNFDLYLTTESFEYSTLDPMSFFPNHEEDTETTESPSENHSEEATAIIDGNEATTPSPLKKLEDGEQENPKSQPKNDQNKDGENEEELKNLQTTTTTPPFGDVKMTTDTVEEDAVSSSEKHQTTTDVPEDDIVEETTEFSSTEQISTQTTTNHDISNESTGSSSPIIDPSSTEILPSEPSPSVDTPGKMLETSPSPQESTEGTETSTKSILDHLTKGPLKDSNVESEPEFQNQTTESSRTNSNTPESSTQHLEEIETTTLIETPPHVSTTEFSSTIKNIEENTPPITNVTEQPTETSSTAIQTMNTSPASDLSTQMKEIISTTEKIVTTTVDPIFSVILDTTTSYLERSSSTTEMVRVSTQSSKAIETSEFPVLSNESVITDMPETSESPHTTEVPSSTEIVHPSEVPNKSEVPPKSEVTEASPITKSHHPSPITSLPGDPITTTESINLMVSPTSGPDSGQSSAKPEIEEIDDKSESPIIKSMTNENRKSQKTSTVSPVISTVSSTSKVSLASESLPTTIKPEETKMSSTSTEPLIVSTSPAFLASARTFSPTESISTTEDIPEITTPQPKVSTMPAVSLIPQTSESPHIQSENDVAAYPTKSTESQIKPTSVVPVASTTTSPPIKLASTTKPEIDHHSKDKKPKDKKTDGFSSTTMKSTISSSGKPISTSTLPSIKPLTTMRSTTSPVKELPITTTVPSIKTDAPFDYDPKLKKEIEKFYDSKDCTTQSSTTPKIEKDDVQIPDKSGEAANTNLNPNLKFPIEDIEETLELTTMTTTQELLPTFNPQFITPIEEPIDYFDLNFTRSMVESVEDTLMKGPSTSTFRPTTRRRPTEWDEDSGEELTIEFERKPIVPLAPIYPSFKKVDDRKTIATTTPTNLFFKKVDELPGSDFDPTLKKPIEESLEPDSEKRPVIKFIPFLKKPIEEPLIPQSEIRPAISFIPFLKKPIDESVVKHGTNTQFQITFKDPSCNCIKPIESAGGNQVPQREVKIPVNRVPMKAVHRQRPTNAQNPPSRGSEQPYPRPVNVQPALPRVHQEHHIRPINIQPTLPGGLPGPRLRPTSVQQFRPGVQQNPNRVPENHQPTFTRVSQGNNLRPENVWKITLDDVKDILKPIAVPNEVYHAFPNLRPNNVQRPDSRQTSTPTVPDDISQNRFYIIPQRANQNGGSAVQNPIQIIHRYNPGSATPNVIKVTEQEQPRQIYFKYTPMNVHQRVYVPESERRVQVPQRWFAGSNSDMTYRQNAGQLHYSSHTSSGQCYYKVKDGPLMMDGDEVYGRLLINANACKRCFYCCQNQEYEQCSRTKLSECASRNMMQIPQSSSQHVYQIHRDLQHPGKPCKVIETWPNGPHGLPKFQVVCT